jgi:hypothetical protein
MEEKREGLKLRLEIGDLLERPKGIAAKTI